MDTISNDVCNMYIFVDDIWVGLSSTGRVADPGHEKKWGCTDDRHCQSLQTCVEGRCEQFWPASLADNKSKCHDTCKHDVELYENYFYSQTVGKFVHFQFRDQCVVAYFPFGTKTVRLSQSAYDSQSYQSVVHRERGSVKTG